MSVGLEEMVLGYVYLVVAATLWGTIGVAYKLGLQAGADYEWLIVGRPLFAALFASVHMVVERRRPGMWSIVIGVFALGPLYVFYPQAVSRVGAGLASVLLYTAPIWVNIASYKALGEPLTSEKIVALFLGVAGVVLISVPGRLIVLEPLGLLLGLASSASYSLYILLARKAMVRGVPVIEASINPIVFAAPATLLAVQPDKPPTLLEAPYILYLAVACTILPYYLHVKGLKHVEAGKASIVSLAEPLVALALAYILLGEKLTTPQLLGSTLVLAAIVLTINK